MHKTIHTRYRSHSSATVRAEVRIRTDCITNEWSDTYLYINGHLYEWIDVQFGAILDRCGTTGLLPGAHDLLLLAASVYALDKAIPRSDARDGWTRDFSLLLPVQSEEFFAAREILEDCLSFLTGDRWKFRFKLRPFRRLRPLVQPYGYRRAAWSESVDTVMLFSGGLDSAVGCVDWLESHDGRLLLVGHHDGSVPGPYYDQQRVLRLLKRAYPNRVNAILVRAGMRVVGDGETTFRSRSFLFLALAVQPYTMLVPRYALLIPENGVIALNAPLTDSRGGSCSTRTVHPHFLDLFEQCLRSLGLTSHVIGRLQGTPVIHNPLQWKTKGEILQQCRNQSLIRTLLPYTVSCGKRAHRASWVRRTVSHCGRCVPCFFRQAAIHTVGWEPERYGVDIYAGEIPLRGGTLADASADLRAFFALLETDTSPAAMEQRLLANGIFTHEQLRKCANLASRGIEEVRYLLKNMGPLANLSEAHPLTHTILI